MNSEPAQRWLESKAGEMLADLIVLCNQNSGSQNLAGLLRVANWLTAWMDLTPAVMQRIELPARQTLDDEGQLLSVVTGPALRWDFAPTAPRRVLLMIHYDTVFGVEHEFQTCTQLSPSHLRGPGVADAKGGIVVLRYALQAMLKFGLAANFGWTVLLNPDEEVGSESSLGLIHELAPQFDFGLLFEPALPTGELISERKGSGTFTVIVRGRAAHAGRHFEQGRNAIAELSRLVASLDRLNGQRAETTINVGYFSGGGPVNIVPDRATARINVRVADSESATWFEDHLRHLASQAEACDGFTCTVHGGFQSPPKRINAAQQALMRAVEVSALKLKQPHIRWQYTGGVCDGNKLAAAGLPNIDTLGPRGEGLHSHHESIECSSLVEKSKLLIEVFCGMAIGDFAGWQREKVVR